jgi:hypothetical protein
VDKGLSGIEGAPARSLSARATPKLALLVLSAVLSVAIAEIGLRLADYPKTVRSGWRSPMRPGEMNQLGFRGRPIEYTDDDVVVVILSDSQGEAAALPFESMPERTLERHLERLRPQKRFRVFTLGAGGYGNDQQLLVLREYFARYRADLILLWQTPTNDVVNNMFPTHWPWNTTPKPTFWLERGELRGPSEVLGQRLPRFRVSALVEQAFPTDRDADWERRHLPEPYHALAGYAGPVDTQWEQMRAQGATAVSDERIESEKTNFVLSLTPRSPRTQYGLDLTHALLTGIADECARQGSRFSLVHPGVGPERGPVSPYIVNMVQDEVVRVLNGRHYRISNTQFWANLRYMNRGLPYTYVRVTTRDWRVSPTDGHLNAVAMDQVTNDLAQQLLHLAQPAAPPAGTVIAQGPTTH